jgi:hypothetical protein
MHYQHKTKQHDIIWVCSWLNWGPVVVSEKKWGVSRGCLQIYKRHHNECYTFILLHSKQIHKWPPYGPWMKYIFCFIIFKIYLIFLLHLIAVLNHTFQEHDYHHCTSKPYIFKLLWWKNLRFILPCALYVLLLRHGARFTWMCSITKRSTSSPLPSAFDSAFFSSCSKNSADFLGQRPCVVFHCLAYRGNIHMNYSNGIL